MHNAHSYKGPFWVRLWYEPENRWTHTGTQDRYNLMNHAIQSAQNHATLRPTLRYCVMDSKGNIIWSHGI